MRGRGRGRGRVLPKLTSGAGAGADIDESSGHKSPTVVVVRGKARRGTNYNQWRASHEGLLSLSGSLAFNAAGEAGERGS